MMVVVVVVLNNVFHAVHLKKKEQAHDSSGTAHPETLSDSQADQKRESYMRLTPR